MCSSPRRSTPWSGWHRAIACGRAPACSRNIPNEAAAPFGSHPARGRGGAEPVHAVQSVLRHLVDGARGSRRVLPGGLVHLLRRHPRRPPPPRGAPLHHRVAPPRGARQPRRRGELRRRPCVPPVSAPVLDRGPGGLDLLLLLRDGGGDPAGPLQRDAGGGREGGGHPAAVAGRRGDAPDPLPLPEDGAVPGLVSAAALAPPASAPPR